MKKVCFLFITILCSFFILGCNFGDLGRDNTPKVSSVEIIELDESNTKNGNISLEGKVKENSKVYVVQVNQGEEDLDADYVGTLKNEVPFSNISNMERSAGYNEDYDLRINKTPSFVTEWNKKEPKELISGSNEINVLWSIDGDLENAKPGNKNKRFIATWRDEDDPDNIVYYAADYELKYESEYAYVYYFPNIACLIEDGEEGFFSDEDFEEIGNRFDIIYDAEINLMGEPVINSHSYSNLIQTSSKISILVSDIYGDGTEENPGETYGYFWGNDYYINGIDLNYTENSNECQCINIDSFLYKKYPDTVFSTLAHEFNHLLNFTNKVINHKTEKQESWYTEMLSMLSEDLLYENYIKTSKNTVITNRIPWFNGFYNYGFMTWNDHNSGMNYGNTFAYGSFLLRNYGGVELINEIANNPYVNEESITQALKVLKIPSSSGKGYATFEETVKDFALSVINYNVSSDTVKTLNKDVSSKFNGYKYTSDNINLSEYNAVQLYSGTPKYSKIKGLVTYDPKKVNFIGKGGMLIQYAGEGTEEITVTLPEYEGLNMYCVIQNYDEKK